MSVIDSASSKPAGMSRGAGLLPAIVAGIVCGFLAVVMSISFVVAEPVWAELVPRLTGKVGLLPDDPAGIERILAQAPKGKRR